MVPRNTGRRIGSPVLSSTSELPGIYPQRSSGCFMTQARELHAITLGATVLQSLLLLDTPLPHHLDVAAAASWMPLEVNLLACGNRFHFYAYHQAGGSDCFICKLGRKCFLKCAMISCRKSHIKTS